MTATPLPANSRKLANGRFEAQPYDASERGRYRALDDAARFVTLEAAKSYADEAWPNAPIVTIDRYRAVNGWAPYRAATREDGEWR